MSRKNLDVRNQKRVCISKFNHEKAPVEFYPQHRDWFEKDSEELLLKPAFSSTTTKLRLYIQKDETYTKLNYTEGTLTERGFSLKLINYYNSRLYFQEKKNNSFIVEIIVLKKYKPLFWATQLSWKKIKFFETQEPEFWRLLLIVITKNNSHYWTTLKEWKSQAKETSLILPKSSSYDT